MYTKSKIETLKYKFQDVELIEKSNSQAYQELFVLTMLNGKKEGYYLEVGAYHSSIISNTWNLENKFNWKGLSLDIAKKCIQDWKDNRKNDFLLCDATKLDYSKALKDHNAPSHIDYLQLDIDPSIVTYKALQQIPFEEYTFSVITFEHDFFRNKDTNAAYVREKSREYIQSKGYILVTGDICTRRNQPFEDWYVSQDIVNSDHFKSYFSINENFNSKGSDFLTIQNTKIF